MAEWTIKDLKGSMEFGLTIEEGGFSMDLEGEPVKGGKYDTSEGEDHPYCVPKGKSFVKPSNWKIDGTSPAPGYGHLLVFYMLPQNASRNHSKGDITKSKPVGPNCTELFIIFVMNLKFSCKIHSKIFFLFRTRTTTNFCLSAIQQPLPPQQPRQQHRQQPPLRPLQRPPRQLRLL